MGIYVGSIVPTGHLEMMEAGKNKRYNTGNVYVISDKNEK